MLVHGSSSLTLEPVSNWLHGAINFFKSFQDGAVVAEIQEIAAVEVTFSLTSHHIYPLLVSATGG